MQSSDLFLTAFRSIFEDTPPERINLTSRFEDIDEWSSLTLLSLIVLFEEEFQTKVSPQQIAKAKTVEDLYKLVGKTPVE